MGEMTNAKKALLGASTVILLIVCIAGSFLTRGSFSDVNEAGIDKLAYLSSPLSSYEFSEDKDAVAYVDEQFESADLIVACSYTGTRRYSRHAFVSEVEVNRVLKGSLASDSCVAEVIEPVTVVRDDELGICLAPDVTYIYGAPMMVEGGSYMLFLRAYKGDGVATRYTFVDSPFSMIRLDGDPCTQGMDERYLAKDELQTCSIIVDSEQTGAVYAAAVEEILNRVSKE